MNHPTKKAVRVGDIGFFPHGSGVSGLFLSRTLLATVEFEIAKAVGVETGGLFIAYRDADGTAFPVLACGPGPGATLEFNTFGWDDRFVAEWLFTAARAAERVAEHAGRDWLVGRWHKHTLPVVNPSPQDAEGAAVLVEAFSQEELIELIVACDGHDKPLHFGAFLFRPGVGYASLPTTNRRDSQPGG